MNNLDQIIPIVPLIVTGIATLIGMRAFFVNAPQPVKMLAQLWIIIFLADLTGHVAQYFQMENFWFYNLHHFFLFFFLAAIYFKILENELLRISIQIYYGALIVFVIINSLFIQGLFALQTLTYVGGGVFTIYLSVAYLWQLLVSSDNERITRDPFFWLSFALIVYFGGTVPFFGMFNYLQEHFFEFTRFYYVYISNAFSIFLNTLVIVAFLCRKSYQK